MLFNFIFVILVHQIASKKSTVIAKEWYQTTQVTFLEPFSALESLMEQPQEILKEVWSRLFINLYVFLWERKEVL